MNRQGSVACGFLHGVAAKREACNKIAILSSCASKDSDGCMGLGCRYVPVSKGLSNGGKAGITIAVLVAFVLLVVLPIVLLKRRKARRRAAADQAESRAKLVDAAHDPEMGEAASNSFH